MASTRSTRRTSESTQSPRTRSSVLTKRTVTNKETSSSLRVSNTTEGVPKKSRVERKSYSLRKGRLSTGTCKSTEDASVQGSVEKDSKVVCLSDFSDDSEESEVDFNPEAVKTGSNPVEIVIVSSDDEKSNDSSATCTFTKEEMALIENEIDEDVPKMLQVSQDSDLNKCSKSDNKPVTENAYSSVICSMQDTILMQPNLFLKPAGKSEEGINSVNEMLPLTTTMTLHDRKNEPVNSVIVYSPEKFVCRNMVSNLELKCNEEQNLTLDDIPISEESKCENTLEKPGIEPEITKSDTLCAGTSDLAVCSNINNEDVLGIQDYVCPERSLSRNSRSTNSTISAIHPEDDFYSPGSTDLSMSEDSRSSFRDFGCEKPLSSRKARGRVKTHLHPRSAHRSKRQSQVSSSCSPSEDGSVEPPAKRNKRLPSRAGITWEIGQKLEAVDQTEWYTAKIVEVDEEACEILIHFEGWSVRFDEWVPMDSPKLRPITVLGTKTDSKDKKPTRPQFKANEKVLARWNDGKLYNATVTEVYPDGNHFGILFYDGFSKKLPVSALRKKDKTQLDTKKLLKHESVRKRPFGRIFKANHGGSPLKGSTSSNVTPSKVAAATALPGTVATKQFVVETDHNQYKCPFTGCAKEFRKENLLHSHMKHYHSSGNSSSASGRASPLSPKKGRNRFRRPSEQQQQQQPHKSKEPFSNNEKPLLSHDQAQNMEKLQTVQPESPSEKEIPNEALQELETKSECSPIEPSTLATSQYVMEEINHVNASCIPDEVKAPATVTKPITLPPKPLRSPRKVVYPVTKMETRHAKPCLFRDDSIYTGYISYRSLYAKGTKGSRKSGETEGRKGRSDKHEEEKRQDGRRRKRNSKTDRSQKSEYPDIDDEIAEIKKRRVYRVSESSSRRDDSTRDSVDFEDDDDDDDDDTASEGNKDEDDDEIVRCICGIEEENGLMFQCEECKTWQHAACFNIENEDQVPETYFCYLCVKSKDKSTTERKHIPIDKDEWLTEGNLASFNFIKKKCDPTNGSSVILATHELINVATKSLVVLNSLQHKIQIARNEANPELKFWSKPWKQDSVSSSGKCDSTKVSTEGAPVASNHTQSAMSNEEFLVFDHSYFAQSDAVLDLQEEVVTEVADTSAGTADQPVPLNLNDPTEPIKFCQLSESAKERGVPKRKPSGRDMGKSKGGRFKENLAEHVEERVDTELCKQNLKQHIHEVQNDVEHGLDVIENQLNLLESGLDVSGNEDEDVTPLLKTLKNLCRDLDVVQRFTLL